MTSQNRDREHFCLGMEGFEVNIDPVLELKNLAKTYKVGWRRLERRGVADVSLTLRRGDVLGLLGPNGAGKTTVLKMILGFLRPDSGQITVLGENRGIKVRDRIGFLPERPYFYPHMSAGTALEFYAELFGMNKKQRKERAKSLLELAGLTDAAKLTLHKFSKGMLQRFGIAQALINDPDFLILDEPTSGLDPIGQVQVREVLKSLRTEGKSILLSSHFLSDVENVCDQVCIINRGKAVVQGRIDQLLKKRDIFTVTASRLSRDWHPPFHPVKVESLDDFVRVAVKKDDVNKTIDSIRSSGGEIEEVGEDTKSLEQFFVELVGAGKNED